MLTSGQTYTFILRHERTCLPAGRFVSYYYYFKEYEFALMLTYIQLSHKK